MVPSEKHSLALALLLLVSAAPVHTAGQQNPEFVIFDACPGVGELLGAPGGMGNLLNPVFETAAAVDAEIPVRREMLDCLESVRFQTILPSWFGTVRRNLELFLAFRVLSPGGDPAAIELIDLARVDDPAVERLREDVGLIPPEGFVFVRYFESRDQLPPVLSPAFESPETRAVTVGSRYVAVLTQTGLIGPAGRDYLETTFSHEMVHAFLNAGLDWEEGAPGFPAWFHEGMAIHFSRSGRTHLGRDPGGGVVQVGPTREYETYERVFLYLEETLGQEGLYRAIRGAVANVDADRLLEAVGVDSYDRLVEDVEIWSRWWPLAPRMVRGRNFWVLAIVLFLISIVALRIWRRWQPAVAGSSLEVTLNRNLIVAVRDGDHEEVGYLLRSGADPNARDESGWGVLLWAVRSADPAIVDQLLNQGARVDADVRQAALWRGDPDIERLVADATARQRQVW